MLAACLIPGARVMSGPGLLPKVMSGSVVPTGAEVCIDSHDSFCRQGHMDVHGLGHHLWLLSCPRTVLLLESC